MPVRIVIIALLAGIVSACHDSVTKGPGTEPGDGRERTDVVLIVIDTARADHFSCYGYPHETTPNIDAFAEEAVLFRHAHSVASWTLPAHMSMFTGLLPGEHGANWLAYSEPADMSLHALLDRSFEPAEPGRILASRLKEAGYATAGFSTNPWVGARTGLRTGFDDFVESWRSRRHFRDSYAELPPETKIDPEYDMTDTGRVLALFKLRFMGERPGQPFFAFFNFSDPHFPYVPPRDFTYRFGGDPEIYRRMPPHDDADLRERALMAGHKPIELEELIPFYDASLSFADFMVGNLLDWLRERDLYDNTLIIVTSDHGEHLGEEGRFSHQYSIEQELLRVPLLIRYPGGAHGGTIVDNPLVSNIDVYRTILSVAGLGVDGDDPSSSIDLADPERIDRQRLLAEYYFSEAQLRQVKEAYEPFDDRRNRVVRRAVYTDGFKVTFDDLDYLATEPVGEESFRGDDPPDIDALTAWIYGYAERIAGSPARTIEATAEDAERIEQLRALGYLD